jgi:hypothetical protein
MAVASGEEEEEARAEAAGADEVVRVAADG